MKTCQEMRLENARVLAAIAGSPAEFARRLDMQSQQANALVGPNPKRGIGHEKAREIEAAFGKEVGWLDHDHSAEGAYSPISETYNALSNEAQALISCVALLDRFGDLAHKSFILHTGILRLSAAYAELQTDSAHTAMAAEVDRLLGALLNNPGGINEREKPG